MKQLKAKKAGEKAGNDAQSTKACSTAGEWKLPMVRKAQIHAVSLENTCAMHTAHLSMRAMELTETRHACAQMHAAPPAKRPMVIQNARGHAVPLTNTHMAVCMHRSAHPRLLHAAHRTAPCAQNRSASPAGSPTDIAACTHRPACPRLVHIAHKMAPCAQNRPASPMGSSTDTAACTHRSHS